jgi:antitoxin FitA
MASITINLPDEQLQKIQKLAQERQVSPEALLQASIENWLSSPKKEFSEAVSYVLQKNAELYRRLA